MAFRADLFLIITMVVLAWFIAKYSASGGLYCRDTQTEQHTLGLVKCK